MTSLSDLVEVETGLLKSNGVVKSASVIPFIPDIDVQFLGRGFMSNREMFAFFDGTDIHNYIQMPNIIVLRGSQDYHDLTTRLRRRTFTSGSNTALILHSYQDHDTGNTFLRVANVSGVWKAGMVGTDTVNPSTVDYYIHVSGTCSGNGSATTLVLANDSAIMANNYWGTSGSNTVYLVGGVGIRQYGNISAFNNVTKTLTISNSFAVNPTNNTRYTIGRPSGGYLTNDFGTVGGVFVVPSDKTIAFKTGDREFKLTDSPTNVDTASDTRGTEIFYSEGLKLVVSGIKDKTIIKPPDPPHPPIIPPGTNTHGNEHTEGGDPLAQTFFVSDRQFPSGIFISSIDLFFKRKDSNNVPVFVELRNTVNGYVGQNRIYGARTYVYPNKVNVSDSPSIDNAATATTFTFPHPVYLAPGQYSFVVKSPSVAYEIYEAEMGQQLIGKTNIASKQPYVGSLQKSENASTWIAFPMTDIMFVMRRAKFLSSGSATFKGNLRKQQTNYPTDLLYTHLTNIIHPNTTVDVSHSVDSGSTFTNYTPDTYYSPSSRINLDSDGKYRISVSLTTKDDAVSPVLRWQKYSTVAIEKKINNGNITNAQIAITYAGAGYSPSANIALVFGSGAGNTTPAVGFALADGSGVIDSVIITDGGTRFTDDMTVTPASGNATFNFVSETDKRGGPCKAKYISRVATLAPGFEGGDLRLWLTATKPSGTEIKVYYKVRNNNDPEPFDNKKWNLFYQITPDTKIAGSKKERIEYEYRVSPLGVSTTEIKYTTDDDITFATFHQYAIKIVMLSNNTVNNPIVYDMRCVALPGYNPTG